ncbi:hypothetical protein AJ78_08247 [Emergomyces pasteurianus Ep9510]|uniref:Uncharacterized protein n=1 Tax=Emergomyces pasteurianus Ep9510 TaxID=1447872 RepID=A0A1J9P3Y6_9EURO|nr:hypothetical protein AJ78_08247 [Emergomyces pasteurianus Ep9510]
MQLYRNRYDGTDYVALLIQEVLRLAEKQNLISLQPNGSATNIMPNPNTSSGNGEVDTNISKSLAETSNVPISSGKSSKSWSEVFIRQPRFYLRLSLSIDFAFARGQYPRDTDLPALVRELHLEEDGDHATETATMPVDIRLKNLPPLRKSQPEPPTRQKQQQQPGDQSTVQNTDVYYGVNNMVEVSKPEQQALKKQPPQLLVSSQSAGHKLAPQLTTKQLLFNPSTPSPVNLREVNLDFLDLERPLLDSLNGGAELGTGADDSGEDGDFNFGNGDSSLWDDDILEEIMARVHT